MVDEIKERRAPGLHTRGRTDDEAMRLIGDLEHLVYLDLANCTNISTGGLKHLASLARLEYLAEHATKLSSYSIWISDVTDRSLELLARMPAIESLLVYGCDRITDVGVRCFAALPRLEAIDQQENAHLPQAAVTAFDGSVRINFHPSTAEKEV